VLCDADRTEPPLQRGLQPLLIRPLESVCRPSDVTVGPDQQCADLNIVGRADHDIDAVCPPTCGVTHTSAGQIEQYRTRCVQ
jgi:hypothetical protein